MPEAASSRNPPGSPEMIDQEYGFTPPDAKNVCAYDTPIVPLKSGGRVVIVKEVGLMIKAKPMATDCCPAESVTWSANVETPAVVGMPVIVPAAESSVRPAGSEPCVTRH